ncbi:hypothetical protein MCBRY_003276 [Methylocystis bryophila]
MRHRGDSPPAALVLGQGHVVGVLGDDPCHPLPESGGELLGRDRRVLDDIMQERGGQKLLIGAPGGAGDEVEHLDRMIDVGFLGSALAPLVGVRLGGVDQGAG